MTKKRSRHYSTWAHKLGKTKQFAYFTLVLLFQPKIFNLVLPAGFRTEHQEKYIAYCGCVCEINVKLIRELSLT